MGDLLDSIQLGDEPLRLSTAPKLAFPEGAHTGALTKCAAAASKAPLPSEAVSAISSTMDEQRGKPVVPPRLLSRSQAAAYCNVSPGTFSNWVRLGRLPSPLPGTTRWDLKAIDFALDAIS